jgi:hypothetical protein
MKQRFLGLKWKMALSVIGALLLATSLPAQASTDVPYFDPTAGTAGAEEIALSATDITSCPTTALTDGWYLVSGNINCTNGIIISGDVTLILADGSSLTVTGASNQAGIGVVTGNSLTIYAQSTGSSMGKLDATGEQPPGSPGAGIGGNDMNSAGSITINGGDITAFGGNSAGIGGGRFASGGEITINGGKVTATGEYAAGIGGGSSGSGGQITITGGEVMATGGNGGAGIGGGDYGPDGTVLITGGTVTAIGGSSTVGDGGGAGIGGGGTLNGLGGTITITGDANVTATGGDAGSTTGGGAGIGSGGNSSATPEAAGQITIDTTGKVNAQGGSGLGTGGAGANIGQGGYTGGTGAGIQAFVGPVLTSTSPSPVALGGEAKFTCEATPMTGSAAAPAGGLTFSSSAWQYPNMPAGTATIWLPLPPPPLRSPSSWPAGVSSSNGVTLDLSPVTASDLGYYHCAVMATGLAGDSNSSILYVGRQAVELRLPATTPIPTLNPATLALLALSLMGLAGFGWRWRG